MQRREFLKSTAAAAVVSGGLAEGASTKPNFLFMIADDLTVRGINAMGNSEVHTPNLDRLIKRGVAFTHCFHQGSWLPAVCVASRSMLNSGMTCFRVQKEIEHTPLWGETLGNAGYDTCIVGKWHLSKENLARSFKQQGKVSGGMFESGPSAYNRPEKGSLGEATSADYVVLGGGHAELVDPLPPKARQGGNEDAFTGGFRLWEDWVEPHDRPASGAWRVVG